MQYPYIMKYYPLIVISVIVKRKYHLTIKKRYCQVKKNI